MPLSTIKKTMIHAIDKARINCQTIEPVSSIEADFLRMTFLEKNFYLKTSTSDITLTKINLVIQPVVLTWKRSFPKTNLTKNCSV